MADDADIENWLAEIGSDARFSRRLKVSAARLLLLRIEQKLRIAPYRLDEPTLHDERLKRPIGSVLH